MKKTLYNNLINTIYYYTNYQKLIVFDKNISINVYVYILLRNSKQFYV